MRGTQASPQILDVLRRKFVALTPEEWVRQHFVHLLVDHLGYPSGLLANEVQLRVGDKVLRADSVLYAPDGSPRMIIEYKAPHVSITQRVFDQAWAYSQKLHADYLMVSNGMEHYVCRRNGEAYVFLPEIPDYENL